MSTESGNEKRHDEPYLKPQHTDDEDKPKRRKVVLAPFALDDLLTDIFGEED